MATILAVDDDDLTLAIINEIGTKSGHTIIRAATAAEAAANVKDRGSPIDVALVDFHLPDGTGTDLIEKMHQIPELESAMFVIMSADQSEGTMLRVSAHGIDDFFEKPVRPEIFRLRLNNWIRMARQKTEIREQKSDLTREKLRLAAYFPNNVVARLATEGSDSLEGAGLNASILFIDVRGFTSISESLDPHLVANLLNFLFADIMDLIFAHSGSVNKIMGDALLATFGCPLPAADDAANAVRCALSIRDLLVMFNTARPEYLREDIALGMGIATGHVFAGNIGSYRRREYTVIGDTVNTASRLQNLTKKTGTDLLIDESTRLQLADDFICRKIGITSLRGKKELVPAYTVESRNSSAQFEWLRPA